MMFNNIIQFTQNKLQFIYKNSYFLQCIDLFILLFILATFVLSTVFSSDAIGFFALVVMFLTAVKMIFRTGEKFTIKSFEYWLLLYFLIVVISLFGSTLFSLSLKGFFKTFVYLGFYVSVVQYLKTNKKQIPLVLGTIALCTVGEAFIGFLQSFLHLNEISTWQDTSRLNPEDVISRVYGTLKPLNPNLFGGYLISGFPVVLGSVFYFVYKKLNKMAFIMLGATLLSIYTIFQTGCRGAYLALMLIIGLTFLLCLKFFGKKYKKLCVTLISSFGILFVLSIMCVNSLRLRFLSIFAMRNDSSNSFRFNVYHSALEMFKDNWLLGIGVGNKNFREIYGLYMKTGFDALSAYNIYLEIAVESGIFALIAFLGFIFDMVLNSIKFIFTTKNTENIILVSISLIAILAVLFHGFVDTIFFRPQLQFTFWTFVAIITVLLPQKNTTSNTNND